MFAMGYEQAADLVMKHIEAEGADNSIVYPLLLLARHTVELALKQDLHDAHRTLLMAGCSSSVSLERTWSTHNLETLSADLEAALKPLMTLGGPWDEIRRFLVKWERADPDGNFARYGREVGGKPVKVKGNVSVQAIWPNAVLARDYLYGVGCELEEQRDAMSQI